MGNADKVIRVIVAIALLTLYFTDMIGGTLGVIGLVVAGIFLVTSAIGFCPLYAIFGIKTCKN